MDTGVRFVSAAFSVALVLWVRYAAHAMAMAALLITSKQRGFRTGNPAFQIARGALLAFSSTMAFAALRHMPVAEFTAISMLTPIVVTILASVWLKESVSLLRWVLVAGGFIGALIVIRPGSGVIGWVALLPAFMTFTNAGFQILTTRYAQNEDPYTTNFYTGATGTMLATPILLATVDDPVGMLTQASWAHLGALLGLTVLGTLGHLMLIMALSRGQASQLMPFQYTQLGAAVLAGWLAFNAVPDQWSTIGMLVIGACGAIAAWMNVREAAKKRQPITAVAADGTER
jgi:drug/metabolite transporter (DMT)-like permease